MRRAPGAAAPRTLREVLCTCEEQEISGGRADAAALAGLAWLAANAD